MAHLDHVAHRRRISDALDLTASHRLRNRLVATAHGRAAVLEGVPTVADAEYWARVSDGGVAMCIAGGTVVGASSTHRTRMLTEAWREDVIEGLCRRADAMKSGGALSVLQILHLGRETLGADGYHPPVAPSAVRSPREPTRPRVLTDGELDAILEGFRTSAANAAAAGFEGIELHAAHGYFLAHLISGTVNQRDDATTVEQRMAVIGRVARMVREAAPGQALGVRMSVGDADDSGVAREDLPAVLAALDPAIDYVNLTVGMRADYVRDMATARPPLLDEVAALRELTSRPLLISHGFRDGDAMQAAVDAGADMVGMARALIADPQLPKKLLRGAGDTVRPCVACNEDCRAFDPALLCSVNPDLGAPGQVRRQAVPTVVRPATAVPERVAVVGAGPAGLEAAVVLAESGVDEVVLLDRADRIGGTLAAVATLPTRRGWGDLIGYYERRLRRAGVALRLEQEADADVLAGFEAVVDATGAQEHRPAQAERALTVTELLAAGVDRLRGVDRAVIVDDGFSWWPHVNALELAVAADVREVVLATPGTAFAGAIPAEARVQLLKRLRGTVDLRMRPMTQLSAVVDGAVDLRSLAAGSVERVEAGAVVVVGERRSRPWTTPFAGGLITVGDAAHPRRVAHAIAEGGEAARMLAAAGATAGDRPISAAA